MKKYFTLPLFIFLSLVLRAQTYVSGFISANTTWTVAGSPYVVVGNTLLSHGYRLTIEPLVVVKFDTNKVLQIDGELIAIGRPGERITFTSLQASPKPGDWGKIHFADTCVDAVFDTAGHYVSGSIMKYCDVMYGGGIGFGEIHLIKSSPYFSHCKISYSSLDGIFSINQTYSIDSSVVSNCNGIGLHFDRYFDFTCSTVIQDDSIINNQGGGIKFNGSFGYNNCNLNHFTVVRRCVFLSNSTLALNVPGGGWDSVVISENYFENNNCNQGVFGCGGTRHTIECNKFINNQSSISIFGVGTSDNYNSRSSSYIQYNTIEGNTVSGNDKSLISVTNHSNYYDYFFRNNVIRNNTCSLGQIFSIGGNVTIVFQIHNNIITGNVGKKTISLQAPNGNGNGWRYLNMSLNNIINTGSQYEFYNNVPYGGPNIRIDSNYWGNVSSQHMDSTIYDYFDYGNLSVVYYQPILTSPVEVDTTCPPNILTIVAEEKNNDVYSYPFPNPFSTYTTIMFDKPLKDASMLLYNVFGQKVKTIEAINAKEITVSRNGLADGIYIYEVVEKGNRIANGKLVVD